MRKIGIIGGMGPEATLDFYGKIIQSSFACHDQDHIPVTIEVCPQIPDRTGYILGKGENPFPLLLKACENLIKVGASSICMPCNTAHYFIEQLNKEINVPFINMIECVRKEIQDNYPKASRIGLLATSGTVSSGVYAKVLQQNNLSAVEVSDDFQARMMDIIYEVKSGRQNEVIDNFQACIDEIEDLGADVIIAGCTELPLLVPSIISKVAIIDPTQCLAENVVKFSLSA